MFLKCIAEKLILAVSSKGLAYYHAVTTMLCSQEKGQYHRSKDNIKATADNGGNSQLMLLGASSSKRKVKSKQFLLHSKGNVDLGMMAQMATGQLLR